MATALPPAKYDHPFPGRVVEESLPFYEVTKRCKNLADAMLRKQVADGRTRVEACSWLVPDPRDPSKMLGRIVLPAEGDGVTKQLIEILRRHETGHLNGWKQNHEDGTY